MFYVIGNNEIRVIDEIDGTLTVVKFADVTIINAIHSVYSDPTIAEFFPILTTGLVAGSYKI